MTPGSTNALYTRFDLVRTKCLDEVMLSNSEHTSLKHCYSAKFLQDSLSYPDSPPDMQGTSCK